MGLVISYSTDTRSVARYHFLRKIDVISLFQGMALKNEVDFSWVSFGGPLKFEASSPQ